MLRFEDFTSNVQAAAILSEKIMERYGHGQINTEHFLMALCEQPDAINPKVLALLKLDTRIIIEGLDRALRILTKPIFRRPGPEKVVITPRLHRVVERSYENSIQLGENKITGEDLLLAILSEKNTPAALELEKAGLTRAHLTAAMRKVHGKGTGALILGDKTGL
jgi:ATP-dependent Clp protease ATP-binding subunit ClpC